MTLRTHLSGPPETSAALSARKGCGVCRSPKWVLLAAALVVAGAAGTYALKGTGALHAIRGALGLRKQPAPPPVIVVPSIVATIPEDVSTGFDPADPILLKLGGPPLDPRTISDDAVGLFRFDNRERIAAKITYDAQERVIRIQPLEPLEPHRNYRVHVLPGITDLKGAPLKQRSFAFFTSSKPLPGVAFEQVPLMSTEGEGYTCLNFGPDGRLYASTHDGRLLRFDVKDDGTLGPAETVFALAASEGGPRLMTGFTFDPRSTAQEPVIYLTHSEFGFGNAGTPVNDFTGKIARLGGAKFDRLQTLVENLPRSARDHATNQPNFGPDGALYVPQPSNTATGAPDAFWFMREEHGLCATILRLDVDAIPPGAPAIDARTTDAGGPFDIHAGGSPLSVYAYGLRMPYDVLWHSNGNLYASVNGASSSGATPAGKGAFAIPYVNLAEHDWLFRVEKDRYYGHPNPKQGYLVLNGGNPTDKPDFNEVSDYPVGIRPDAGWTGAIFDYGMHVSANGMVEIRSDRFPQLKGKVFVCRYNIGSGLLLLGFAPDGSVNYASGEIPGTQNLTGPLDVIEDVRTGNLYVAEYFERSPGQTRLTLLRAVNGPTTAPAK